ncbi:hypothetical protein HMPREF1000_04028 [Parabacteroides sp. D26]|nr:hypothetical protein HMPREF1000_04028 [Parabacteroides sp. D26]
MHNLWKEVVSAWPKFRKQIRYTSLICSILGFHTITELASDYEKF